MRPVLHRGQHVLTALVGVGDKRGVVPVGRRQIKAALTIARFDVVRCMPLVRLPGSMGEPDLTDARVDARRRVGNVWHVVGLQRSIRAWAIRQGWGGRPVRQEQAQGILVAALGMLAGHYGYCLSGR